MWTTTAERVLEMQAYVFLDIINWKCNDVTSRWTEHRRLQEGM